MSKIKAGKIIGKDYLGFRIYDNKPIYWVDDVGYIVNSNHVEGIMEEGWLCSVMKQTPVFVYEWDAEEYAMFQKALREKSYAFTEEDWRNDKVFKWTYLFDYASGKVSVSSVSNKRWLSEAWFESFADAVDFVNTYLSQILKFDYKIGVQESNLAFKVTGNPNELELLTVLGPYQFGYSNTEPLDVPMVNCVNCHKRIPTASKHPSLVYRNCNGDLGMLLCTDCYINELDKLGKVKKKNDKKSNK